MALNNSVVPHWGLKQSQALQENSSPVMEERAGLKLYLHFLPPGTECHGLPYFESPASSLHQRPAPDLSREAQEESPKSFGQRGYSTSIYT